MLAAAATARSLARVSVLGAAVRGAGVARMPTAVRAISSLAPATRVVGAPARVVAGAGAGRGGESSSSSDGHGKMLGAASVAAAALGMSTAAAAADDEMPMRVLGNTGLVVSVLSFGFWATFGVKDGLHKQEGVDKAKDIMRVARDAGINTFDNAEAYGNPYGAAEEIMGEAIQQLRAEDPEKWRRSDIVITTKIFWGGAGVNEKGLSKKHIMEGLDKSLKRLQADYVDLVFCHRPDKFTPTATVVRAMTDAVRSGKATAWGTSEWSAQQITEAYWIAKTEGLEPPQMEQPQYHLFCRDRFEKEYERIYKEPYRIGTTIWSPLASGLLTGKYNDEVPKGSRLDTPGYGWLAKRLEQWRSEGKIDKVRALTKFAKDELDCSVAQLALAWCLKNENVTTVLLGATKPQQLKENLVAISVARKMTAVHLDKIDEIVGNKPALEGTFRQFAKL